MNTGADNWLTLAEVIHQSSLHNLEVRRIIKKFGKFLGPRDFGDIIKYPPAAAEAVILIGELCRQGFTTGEIATIMSREDHLPGQSLQDQRQREVGTLLKLQNQAGQLLRPTCEMAQNLVAEVAVLAAKIAEADGEIQNSGDENQNHPAGVDNQKLRVLN